MELAKVAKEAKQELEEANITLSVDPTKDVKMLDDIEESEDVVRERLFKRWLEVCTRVEAEQNSLVKTNLRNLLEVVREAIGNNDVMQQENMIRQQLDSIWNRAED